VKELSRLLCGYIWLIGSTEQKQVGYFLFDFREANSIGCVNIKRFYAVTGAGQ